MGFTTVRFSNHAIGTNLDDVLTTILSIAKALPPRFGDGLPHPPTPFSEGKGES